MRKVWSEKNQGKESEETMLLMWVVEYRTEGLDCNNEPITMLHWRPYEPDEFRLMCAFIKELSDTGTHFTIRPTYSL